MLADLLKNLVVVVRGRRALYPTKFLVVPRDLPNRLLNCFFQLFFRQLHITTGTPVLGSDFPVFITVVPVPQARSQTLRT